MRERLADFFYNVHLWLKYPYNKRIVTMGGGTGHYNLLRGLVLNNNPRNITAIPGTWDTGGSSGRLREELGKLPLGDGRQCVVGVMVDPSQQSVAQRLFDDRMTEVNGPMQGHNVGNLMLARLDTIYKGPDRALEAMRHLFRNEAEVVPVSLTDLQLVVETVYGNKIVGESAIDTRGEKEDFDPSDQIITHYFDTCADPNPKALEAIQQAEAIIFSAGDLYTSVLPHLNVNGVREAIMDSGAKLFFVLNLMTKKGETDFYRASHHLRPFLALLGDPDRLNYVIANSNRLPPDIKETYRAKGQNPVELDIPECKILAPKTEIISEPIARSLVREGNLYRHDPGALSRAILSRV